MATYGYTMSSEEHPPPTLVDNARKAEEAGFDFLTISDHFHPWVSAQGHSPFVWSVLGAIAASTDRVSVGVGVTCPTIRMHPAVIAQAAATTSLLFGGRFFLGVGTGEALNEHVAGTRWPGDPRRCLSSRAGGYPQSRDPRAHAALAGRGSAPRRALHRRRSQDLPRRRQCP